MQQPTRTARLLLTACLPVLLLPEPSRAQQQPDEVVITTGFRPERLGNVAGSASVIDAATIKARGAEHLETVLTTAANVTLTSGASRGRFVQMRGIGDLEQFVDPKHFPAVGITVDGIDLGGIANAAMLFDTRQIEVLRGPQGTRFGASALAGHVDIRTAPATQDFDAYIETGAGNYGEATLGFAAGGGLSETLAGRIAVQQHQGDGYIDNAFLGRDDTNDYDEATFRGKLSFTPGANASYDVTALRFDSDNGYDAYSFDNTRTTLSDAPGTDALALSALGLTGRWALAAEASLEAHVNWLDSDLDYGYDEDWSNPELCVVSTCPFGGFSNTDRYQRARDDVALDLRVLSDRFVAGVYLQDRSEALLRQYYGPFASDYSTERQALYGQLIFALAPQLKLTVGLRHERFADDYRDSAGAQSTSDDTFTTGELALSYAASDSTTYYGLIARGSRPGGINTEASSIYALLEPRFQQFLDNRLGFADESLTNIEVGVKAAPGNGRLGIRAALFDMTRDNAQLESWFLQYDPFLWVGILDNADATVRGAEIDLDYAVSANWQLTASVGLLDTDIEALTTFDLNADDFVVRRGIEQSKSPSWQVALGSEWRILDDWVVTVGVDARDAERYGHYHDGLIDRLTRVNASVGRQFGRADMTLWVRNLLDEDYAVHGLYFGNDPRNGYVPERYLQPGEPRYAGVSLRFGF